MQQQFAAYLFFALSEIGQFKLLFTYFGRFIDNSIEFSAQFIVLFFKHKNNNKQKKNRLENAPKY